MQKTVSPKHPRGMEVSKEEGCNLEQFYSKMIRSREKKKPECFHCWFLIERLSHVLRGEGGGELVGRERGWLLGRRGATQHMCVAGDGGGVFGERSVF